jgi:hypothetical protein
MLKYDEEEAYVKIPIAVPTSFLFFLGWCRGTLVALSLTLKWLRQISEKFRILCYFIKLFLNPPWL